MGKPYPYGPFSLLAEATMTAHAGELETSFSQLQHFSSEASGQCMQRPIHDFPWDILLLLILFGALQGKGSWAFGAIHVWDFPLRFRKGYVEVAVRACWEVISRYTRGIVYAGCIT